MMLLAEYGFDENLRSIYNQKFDPTFAPARIIEVNKNSYQIICEHGEIKAELTGKFLFNSDDSLSLPTVGDWVVVQLFDDNTMAIVHDIVPRKTLLTRKDPGKKVDHQLIAANIDFAFIVQSLDSNFNLNRLERYLVAVTDSNIEPVILLSKADLLEEAELIEKLDQIKRLDSRFRCIPFSNLTHEGIKAILGTLHPAKTYCLVGSSGVGKTSLINLLTGSEDYKVESVREKDHKGRHTTTKRELIKLPNGSILIDTPGMREFANFGVEGGLADTFDEISRLIESCKFSDCNHVDTEGCAVLAALEDGHIDQNRYENYIKIKKESDFYEMSYLDKRRRDRQFGKMIKKIMKNSRKK